LDNSPQPQKDAEISFATLGNNNAFLLDLDGHKVLAVRLPRKVEKEISGQESEASGGILSKLKAKLGFETETDRWLTVANIDNPLLDQLDTFGELVVQGLTNAIGAPVARSGVTVSASVPVNAKEESLEIIS
jgi:hypothetical protein